MRLALFGCVMTLALASAGVVADAQDVPGGPIASSATGALDVPSRWDCRRIEPEYSDWLENGNSPESWKYAGKTYRDVADDKTYNWQDWLDWANRAGCFKPAAQTGGLTQTNLLIGGAITAFGAALIGAQAGSGPKSPG